MVQNSKKSVVFQIKWDGQQQAQLLYLLDNGVPVVSPIDALKGRGSVGLEYQTRRARVHHLEWSLWFAGKELDGLEATVTIGEADEHSLAEADDTQEHRWIAAGNAMEAP